MSEAIARASRSALVRSSSVIGQFSGSSRPSCMRALGGEEISLAHPGRIEPQLAGQVHQDATKVHGRGEPVIAVRLHVLQVDAGDAGSLRNLLQRQPI